MSEVKDGIIGMPFELAMGTAISRRQFHGCAVAEIARLKAELECALGDLATAKGIIDRLQKDADRYEFLRSGDDYDHEDEPLRVSTCDQSGYIGDALDSVVDAHMSNHKNLKERT